MVNLRIIEVLTFLRTLLIVPEERLDLVGRRESNQHSALSVANKCPDSRGKRMESPGFRRKRSEPISARYSSSFEQPTASQRQA